MTNRKLVVLALSFLLASSSVGLAAGTGKARGVGAGQAGAGSAASDTTGADVIFIPDMANGGPPAIDVTKDLPTTAGGPTSEMTPPATPTPPISPGRTGKRKAAKAPPP